MPERIEETDFPIRKPEPSPLDEGLPLEKTIELSHEGGLHAGANEIARLLGHNNPMLVQEYLDDEGH